jgi:hypothetical protein
MIMRPSANFLLTPIVLFSFLFVLSSSCNKADDDTMGTANLSVHLKTSERFKASSYQAINLDIQQVYYHNSTDSAATTGWFALETHSGIYDLLKDSQALDTLLAFDSSLQVQTISQIRLVLGDGNSVKKEGQVYPLKTPSGQSSGIKMQVHAELEAGKNYKMYIDINVDKSILETGNGTIKMKPVINTTIIEQ